MRAQFVRGASSRKEILDRLLNRIITIDMLCYDVQVTNGQLDRSHEETDYLVDELEKARVSYRVSGKEDFNYVIELSGTKDQLLQVLPMWDAHQRTPAELARELANWEGDPEELWEVLT
jgi:hypothetical protein